METKQLILRCITNLFTCSLIGMSGCTGYILPPASIPSPPANATSFACPAVPATISPSGCPTVRITNAMLACGGDGKMAIALSTVGSGSTRLEVQLSNGSVFSGTFFPVDVRCFQGIGVPISISFGLVYTGDQGTEPAADGTTTPCIVRSKSDFTQFSTTDPIISIFESAVKDQLHRTLDTAAINQVFGSPGKPPLPGRCARWRPL